MIGTLKGTVFICTFAIASATALNARAAHATNFLDLLQNEVTNRIAAAGTNSADKRALEIANKALSRNSKTFAADLGILANAATALNLRFSDDGTLIALEEEALAAYELEAEAQIMDAYDRIGTNSIPKGLSNQLNMAQSTLTNLIASSNSLPDRARALAKVFNKLRSPISQITKKYKAVEKPNEPFTAPGTLRGKNLDLVETAIVNEQTKFYFHSTVQNDLGQTVDYFSYVSDNPEELGTWTYQKTGEKTAVVHCNPDYPYDYNENHDVLLTFTSATAGTFAGHVLGQPISGTFFITDAPSQPVAPVQNASASH